MNIFLLIATVFIFTFLVGKLLEKIRVPWIFAALVLGALLAVFKHPFGGVISGETFEFFAQLGMYLLLFLIGLELNVEKLKERSGFIFRSAFLIILLEGLIGSLVVHFVFGYAWPVSILVALSFATVGEAILIPILQEFRIVNTKLGQSIIGIGTADDIIEILLLIFASVLVGTGVGGNVWAILGVLAILSILLAGLVQFQHERERFRFKSIETLFLFVLFVFFLFIGVGSFAHAAPIAAILAGAGIRIFLPKKRLAAIESEIKTMTYGLFAPLFFVWVGAELNVEYLVAFPLLILLVVAASKGAKLLGSYIAARRELGTKGSILLGIGLSIRFSTSIIIIKFLFDNGVIGSDIFTVIVASSIVFKFIVPVLFSQLLTRWGFAKPEVRDKAVPA